MSMKFYFHIYYKNYILHLFENMLSIVIQINNNFYSIYHIYFD